MAYFNRLIAFVKFIFSFFTTFSFRKNSIDNVNCISLPGYLKNIRKAVIVSITFLSISLVTWGQAIGDYGTASAGPNRWDQNGSWVVCVTAGTWTGATAAAAIPNAGTNVWIRAGHTIIVRNSNVCKNIDIAGGVVYRAGNTYTLTVNGNISGSGSMDMSLGTANILNVGGNYTNTGTFTCGDGTVNYNGTTQQVAAVNYYNLTISGGGTKTLQGNVSVNSSGILTFTSGLLELANFNLTINNNAAAAIAGAFSSSSMIATDGTGYLIKNATSAQTLSPIGGGGFYSPATLTGGTSGTLSIRAVSTSTLGPNVLPKYWDVKTSVGGQTFTFIYTYSSSEGNQALSSLNSSNSGTSWVTPSGTTTIGAYSVTVTGTTDITTTSTWWTASVPQTYYSYQNGSWSTATTWTSDPSGTTQVRSTIPGNRDLVEILSGRTVNLPANIATTNLNVTIDESGFLDLSTYQFTGGLSALAGQGTLIISSSPAVFPTPITTNNFVNAGGGTVEYRTNSNLPTQATYNNLSINKIGATVTQTILNLNLNGDLHVKSGTFQINDNTPQRVKLTVNGNVTVDGGAFLTVGTGVTNTTASPIGIATGGTPPFINYFDAQSHRIVLNGNFTNNGTVRLTNLSDPLYNAFPPTTLGATTGFATVYFQGLSDNTLLCAGPTYFYNIVVDKGTDQTYKLILYTSVNYSNFRLLGANTAGCDIVNTTANNPNVKKALWIRNGTLELQGTTVIPSLSEGTNGDGTATPANTYYYIPANGALVLNGVDVVVQTTADNYQEVNAAYGSSAASNASLGISAGAAGSGFSIYGNLEVKNGFFSTKESEGIITTNVASGQFILNNGTVDTKQFLSQAGAASSFEQNGGLFILRGRFQRTPSAYTNATNLATAPINLIRSNDAVLTPASGTFSMSNANNVFTMSGGNMQIYDVCGAASTLAFQVNSSASNMNVTGGTVQFIPTAGTGGTADVTPQLISTTTPLGNVTINRASSATVIQLSTALTVLNDLSLLSGVLSSNNQNISVGGNFTIAGGTTYTPGTNTTILNGTGVQTFTVNLAAPLSLNNLTITKPAGIALNMAGSQTSSWVLPESR